MRHVAISHEQPIQVFFKQTNKEREQKSKDLKKEFTDVKASNKRLTNAVKAASEGYFKLKIWPSLSKLAVFH